jgi:uncharacterized protein (DUF1330 family)
MPAYVFFDILEISDPEKMRAYGQQIGATVEDHGGRYLVKGGRTEVVEGDWQPTIPVIIEFPSLEQAHQWYRSEAYQKLVDLRSGAAKLNAVFIEGVDQA